MNFEYRAYFQDNYILSTNPRLTMNKLSFKTPRLCYRLWNKDRDTGDIENLLIF